MTLDPIATIEAVVLRLPLPAPVQLGASALREREYALVRVRTQAGLVGSAYCLSRGAPIAEAVERLVGPLLTGKDADAIEARFAETLAATVMPGRSGTVMRALGLIDIALWDIKAQRASTPLWRLLGGYQASVPALLVAGYRKRGQSIESLANDLVGYAAAGHRLIKCARLAEPEEMAQLLSEVTTRARPETGLIVDAGYCWSSVEDALRECAVWSVRLAWLEDPFPPERLRAYQRLRAHYDAPVAAGDDSSAPPTAALLDAGLIDVLRIDIPAVGGITPALRLMAKAAEAEVPVSFHIYPEIAIQLAAARAQSSIVESFDTTLPGGNPFDPAHLVTGVSLRMADGAIHAPELPGLGFTLAWPASA